MRRWTQLLAVGSIMAMAVTACGSSGDGSDNATGGGDTPANSAPAGGDNTGAGASDTASAGGDSGAAAPESGASSAPEGSGGAPSGDPIVIGQIASLTGAYQALGSNDKLGAEQAVQEINDSGGLLGRPLKIVVQDDKTQPDQGVIAFNKLVDENVSAVVGSSLSNSSLAIIPVAERAKIPYVSTAAADEQVKPVKPYVFMAPFTASVSAEQLLRYMQAQDITKMAVAYDTANSFAQAGWKTMSKLADKYGITFVDEETFETGTTNFSSVLTHIKGSDAQGLVVWAVGPPAVAITKQFQQAGLDMPLFMTHAEASTLFTEPAGSAAEGIILSCALGSVGPDLPDSEVKDITTKMADTFQKNNGYYPPQFAFDGYNAVYLIANAIKDANSTDPTDIQKALNTITMPSTEGVYKMSDDDHSGLSVDDVAIAQIQADGSLKITDWSKKQLEKTLS